MSESLTREQVAAQLHILYLAKAHELGWPVRHECDVPYDRLTPDGQALDLVFADWHLAQMDEVTQERDAFEIRIESWRKQYDEIRQQLAELKQRREETVAMCEQLKQELAEMAEEQEYLHDLYESETGLPVPR